MSNNDKTLTENHQNFKVKSQKQTLLFFCFFIRNHSWGRRAKCAGPRMPVRALAREARRSSRVQHKSTNTAEARDSEQKGPYMQHKVPNKKGLAPGSPVTISYYKPGVYCFGDCRD